MSGGSVIATDDSGTGHVQLVKLAYSSDGSRTHVVADTDGLKVNVSNATVTVALGSSIPAGSNVIGGVTQSGSWTVTANAGTGTFATIERGATIAHGQVTVTTVAASFIASSSTRRSVAIQNLGTDYVYLGATGITANNGIRLAAGQTFVLDKSPNAQIFAIAASGSQVCSYLTESD